jgi:hypothetical protein
MLSSMLSVCVSDLFVCQQSYMQISVLCNLAIILSYVGRSDT